MKCKGCGGPLSPIVDDGIDPREGNAGDLRCRDLTCPYSDRSQWAQGTQEETRQYVVVIDVPTQVGWLADDSIDAVCSNVNQLLSQPSHGLITVRPLSEILAC